MKIATEESADEVDRGERRQRPLQNRRPMMCHNVGNAPNQSRRGRCGAVRCVVRYANDEDVRLVLEAVLRTA
jgi:hypothetical protein